MSGQSDTTQQKIPFGNLQNQTLKTRKALLGLISIVGSITYLAKIILDTRKTSPIQETTQTILESHKSIGTGLVSIVNETPMDYSH